MKRSELFFSLILIPVDLVAIIAGFAVAYYTRLYLDPFEIIYVKELKEYFIFISYFLPLWIMVFAVNGLYAAKVTRKSTIEFGKILISVPTALMIFVTIMFFIREEFFSRLIIVYSVISITALVTLSRSFIIFLQRLLSRYGIGIKRILIIGNNKITADIINDIEKHPQRALKIIGIISTEKNISSGINENNILGDIEKLGSIVARIKPDEIFQTDPNMTSEENINILRLCEDKHIIFRFVPGLFALYSKNNYAETFAQVPVFEIKRSPLDGWGRIIKRSMDITGSLIAIILSSPIQLVIAIAVKLDSPGPILIVQDRVGRDGNFRFMKFRTMYHVKDTDKRHKEFIKKHGNMFKLKDDPRVTRIGKFLRKTSLDELPQFYNVFRGDMSLVGPRPPMPVEVIRYTREEKQRLGGVKPGITGLWQVSGRSDIEFEEWIKLDKYYIENWSLLLDLVILTKTIWVVLFKRGAY